MEMKAWTYTRRGSPLSVLSLNQIPRPTTAPENHVLIRVTHASLNPSSAYVMNMIPNPFGRPRVAELDLAGAVVTAGENVRAELCEPGTRVFGGTFEGPMQLIRLRLDQGTLCEYVVVHQDLLAVVPGNVTLQQAAGLMSAGFTAVRFVEFSKIGTGDRVLINGASGGVGTFLVQVAKHVVGETGSVVAICSGRNAQMVEGLGADEVVDYTEQIPVEEFLAERYGDRKFAVVFDTIGIQALYTRCPDYLAEGKMYLDVGITPSKGQNWDWPSVVALAGMLLKNYCQPRWLGGTPRTFLLLNSTPDKPMLEKVRAYAERGIIKTVVDSVWPMDEVMMAYQKLESRRAKGKIIIEIQKEDG